MREARPVALVTGASSGIGKAAAQSLVEAGFDVVGTSRDSARVTDPGDVSYVDLDVASDESVAEAVQQVIDRFGRIDVLVNNAGIGSTGAAEESSVAQAHRVFDVNLFGVLRMTNAVLPHMRAQGGGRIVNVSSVVGFVPAPYMAIYAATKHALEGYSESIDHEVRDQGIRVILVQPAFTKTGFDANALEPDAPKSTYASQREVFDTVLAAAMERGDEPVVVGRAVVAAATDRRPRTRYTAGPLAGRISTLRRVVPARAFDKQIRKLNRLAG
jgi:NAD(P)-dependent dehydrogenase (short-subunit alcohol dehydrogenase family)